MLPNVICLGVMFLTVTTIGTTANFFLFTFYMSNVIAGHKISFLTLHFIQLTLVNSTMLVSKGVPQTLYSLGWNNFLDDVGCKVVFYIRRVSVGLSISLTCLLSTFQAITISPNNSRWVEFKIRTMQYTKLSCLFCWIFNLLIEIPIPVSARGPRISNFTSAFDNMFCTSEHIMAFYLIIITSRNVLCLGLMVLTSCYMVFILYKHYRQVQYICNTKFSTIKNLEIRAARTILLLMSIFVSFYSLNLILTLFLSYFDQKSPWMLSTNIFLSQCYPTISPFLLIPRFHRPTRNF
ncbi:vomeronasal type-1 receptor 1-like [Macrotis lagotis]|uniref:vomeronasal type-1 receptor 1-like n=1 Tax=Macrotis lagotis TaxID=92651 RepID=UPI003D68F2CA